MKPQHLLALVSAFLIICSIHLLVFGAVDHVNLLQADAAPLQRADEITYALGKGEDPRRLIPASDPQLFRSPLLSVFVLNEQGGVVAANTQVANRITPVPAGLLEQARLNGIKRVTWLPFPNLRKALVIRYLPERGLYVAVAGTMEYTEDRNWPFIVLINWAACTGVLLLAALMLRKYTPEPNVNRS